MKQSGPRHTAREFALRILFADDILADDWGIALPQERNWWTKEDDLTVNNEAEQFTRHLIKGVREQTEHLDQVVRKNAHNWRTERMSTVDRTILRISTWEMIIERKTPSTVIMNEALELAKCYGTEDSSRFINGILDSISKSSQ